jgi:hypothetical protein
VNPVPDRVRVRAGADHHHRTRVQQGVHAAGLGPVLAGSPHPVGRGGRRDVEGDGDHAVLLAMGHRVTGLVEDPDHLAILRQDVGGEPADPALAGGRREVLQKHGADPPALVLVGDVEGHLRARAG